MLNSTMYLPKIEFCSICGKFEPGKFHNKKFVCFNCEPNFLKNGSIFPTEKTEIKIENRKKNNKKKTARVKTKVQSKVSFSTKSKVILEYLRKDPDKVYKSVDLYKVPEISGKCLNPRSLANAIRELLISEKIFGRDIFINGRKSHKIIALKKELLDGFDENESAGKILEIIKNNSPVESKIFGLILNQSKENALRMIREKLKNKVESWKCGNKHLHILRGDLKSREKILEQYPKAVLVN